jgi:hypothetical protein
MSVSRSEESANASGVPVGDPDSFAPQSDIVARDGVGVVGVNGLGRPTNSGLSTFAKQATMKHPNALKSSSKVVRLYMGIDTAEWSLRMTSADLFGMASVLDQLVGLGEVDDEDRRMVVSRVGLPYRYKLALADGFDLYIPAPEHPEIPLRVHAGARLCMMLGDALEEEVLRTVAWWVGWSDADILGQLTLSRVDICQDVLMAVRTFDEVSRLVASNSSKVVTRGRYRQAFPTGTGYTGFAIGKNEVRLRFYDKQLKAKQNGTWEMWSEAYAKDGEAFAVPDGEVVARVEYQLRGEFLRGCCTHSKGHTDGVKCPGLRTLPEFKQHATLVLDYLSDDWFRLAAPGQGKDHERPMLPVWKAIRVGFVEMDWSQVTEKMRRRAKGAVGKNVDRLLGMAAGCLASAAAVLGHHDGGDSGIGLGAALGQLRQHIDRDAAKWQRGRDRRYSALRYSSKVNVLPYANPFGGPAFLPGGAYVGA